MRLGWCAPLDAAPLLARQGWDYIEVPLVPLGIETPAGRSEALARIAAAPLPVEVFTHVVPPGLNLFAPGGTQAFHAWIDCAAAFVGEAGAACAIFGGRETRRIPPGYPAARAEEVLIEALLHAGEAFADTGCCFVLEALSDAADDPVTGFLHACRLASRLPMPGLRVVADSYHFARMGEPAALVAGAGDRLVHVHLATADRRAPAPGIFDLDPWAGALEAAGYSGRVSVECTSDDVEADAALALTFLRGRWPKE
jgi:sugar phosphate isomerase/epimerase